MIYNYQIDENLTFKHYKEPLKPIPKDKGFGFYGAILMTKDMDKIQCHICGETYRTLAGHITKRHKTTDREYKEKFGIAYKTALISESFRFELKNKTLDFFANMPEKEKEEMKERQREAMRLRRFEKREQPKQMLETKNKRGTCPDQLLDKICKVANEIGRTPTKKEFIEKCGTQKYTHLIYKTFGSWNEAIKLAQLDPHIPEFRGFDDDQLLDLLKSYYKQYGCPPTTSDFSRGLLPSIDTYRRFGGITKAKELAGLPPTISKRWAVK